MRHLDGYPRGISALLVRPRLRLLVILGGEHRVGNGDGEIERHARNAGCTLVGHHLEVIGLASDHRSDGHQRVELVGLRKFLQGQRDFERTGDCAYEDVFRSDPEFEQFCKARLAKRYADSVVEPGLHDTDSQAFAVELRIEYFHRHLAFLYWPGSKPEISRS